MSERTGARDIMRPVDDHEVLDGQEPFAISASCPSGPNATVVVAARAEVAADAMAP